MNVGGVLEGEGRAEVNEFDVSDLSAVKADKNVVRLDVGMDDLQLREHSEDLSHFLNQTSQNA